MAAKIKLKRTARLEGGEAIIESQVIENMDYEEYEKVYTKKSSDVHNLDFAIKDAKKKLELLAISEKTELNAKQKEMLKIVQIALNITEAQELREKLKEMEVTRARLKEEVDSLDAVHKQILKYRQDK